MENGFFLITGASKGIGEALAQKIIAEGHTVLGVSRNRSAALNAANYHHLAYDLSDMSRVSDIMTQVSGITAAQPFDFVCLVNNASAIEPLGSIENCPPAAIDAHLTIGLIAPMILTSQFIQQFADGAMRKKVAFITSGAAVHPMSGASCYSSAKAGLLMFAQCVAGEQKNQALGFEVISISPGMVDTPMQQATRSKTSAEFAMADYFKQAFNDGKLEDAGQVAAKIYTILGNTYPPGQVVNAYEM